MSMPILQRWVIRHSGYITRSHQLIHVNNSGWSDLGRQCCSICSLSRVPTCLHRWCNLGWFNWMNHKTSWFLSLPHAYIMQQCSGSINGIWFASFTHSDSPCHTVVDRGAAWCRQLTAYYMFHARGIPAGNKKSAGGWKTQTSRLAYR